MEKKIFFPFFSIVFILSGVYLATPIASAQSYPEPKQIDNFLNGNIYDRPAPVPDIVISLRVNNNWGIISSYNIDVPGWGSGGLVLILAT